MKTFKEFNKLDEAKRYPLNIYKDGKSVGWGKNVSALEDILNIMFLENYKTIIINTDNNITNIYFTTKELYGDGMLKDTYIIK